MLDRLTRSAEHGRTGQHPQARPGSYERLLAHIREESGKDGGAFSRQDGYLVGVIGFKPQYDGKLNLVPWHFDEGVLLQTVRDVLDRFGRAEAAVYGGEHLVLVFAAERTGEKQTAAARARHLAREVLSTVSKYWNRHVFITLHDEPAEIDGLEKAFHQALRCQDYAFYYNEDTVVSFSASERQEAGQPLRPPRFSFTTPQVGDDWTRETRTYFQGLAGARNRHPAEVKAALTGALMRLDEQLRVCFDLSVANFG